MEERPIKTKYRRMTSTVILETLSALILVSSIVVLLYGCFAENQILGTSAVLIGIIGIICGAFLTVFYMVGEDLHYQSYLMECAASEDEWYHNQTLLKLLSIEEMLIDELSPAYEQEQVQDEVQHDISLGGRNI